MKSYIKQHPFEKFPTTREEYWTKLWSKVGEEREGEVIGYESHDPHQELSQPW